MQSPQAPLDRIAYKGGYKYQLAYDCVFRVDLAPPVNVLTDWIELTRDGNLRIRRGYAWDGPSGPTLHTASFMRGSLVHDALYQLMRDGLIDCVAYRQQADMILRKICEKDGMLGLRAWWVYHAVRTFGAPNALKQEPAMLYAP